MHNNTLGGNCAGEAWKAGPEKENVGHHLQQSGYRTGFFGKYLNQYGSGPGGEKEQLKHVPRGWDEWHALSGNSRFYNYKLSVNGEIETHGADYFKDYLPDLVTNRSLDFIEESLQGSQPFFLYASTPAPHEPADPAPQYAQMYEGLVAPRTPNWNVTKTDRNYLVATSGLNGPMNETMTGYSDIMYRRRILALQSVDDMIVRIYNALEKKGALDNTYIVYAADNGFHLGQWGMALDKRLPYEHDIRLPLYLRGPGIQAGSRMSTSFALNIDMMPTFLAMAQAPIPSYIDGRSILDDILKPEPNGMRLRGEAKSGDPERRDFLLEYNGEGNEVFPYTGCPAYKGNPAWSGTFCHVVPIGNNNPPEFNTPPYYGMDPWCSCQDVLNNTYTCVRSLDATFDLMYCEWETGETEYYNVRLDPWNLENRINELHPAGQQLFHNRLTYLQKCSGNEQCSRGAPTSQFMLPAQTEGLQPLGDVPIH